MGWAELMMVTVQTATIMTDEELKTGKQEVAVSFNELAEIVHAEARQVVRLWHPDAEGSLLHLKNGVNAEVLNGPAAYQLSDGAIVADF